MGNMSSTLFNQKPDRNENVNTPVELHSEPKEQDSLDESEAHLERKKREDIKKESLDKDKEIEELF